MKNKDNRTLNNMAVFTLVIIIMFMSIICIELITVIYSQKIDNHYVEKLNTTIPTKKDDTYDTTGLKFTNVEIGEEKVFIADKCSNGCNLNIKMYGMNYKYIIKKSEGEYILNVIKDNKLLLSDKNLGTKIEDAYFINYLNYIMFYNQINDGTYEYDYANVVDNRSSLDEFTSLGVNEFELTQEGIVYFYDVCGKQEDSLTNGSLVKAIRMPFSLNPKVINTEGVNFNWCE